MEVGQRQPRIECPAFLAFVRRRPCCACGAPAPSQAAHVRYSDAASGNVNPGVGAKPDDRKCVPLCAGCHLDSPGAQHRVGERKFWARVGIDPFALAARLYAQFERRQARTPKQRKKVVARARLMKIGMKVTGGPFGSIGGIITAVSRPKPRGQKRKWASRPFPKGRKLRSKA